MRNGSSLSLAPIRRFLSFPKKLWSLLGTILGTFFSVLLRYWQTSSSPLITNYSYFLRQFICVRLKPARSSPGPRPLTVEASPDCGFRTFALCRPATFFPLLEDNFFRDDLSTFILIVNGRQVSTSGTPFYVMAHCLRPFCFIFSLNSKQSWAWQRCGWMVATGSVS